MPYSPLPSRAVLRLSGDDTLNFLQGLVTNDVLRLPKEKVQYAAMLTPQGKFLHGFFLFWHDGAVLVDVDNMRAVDLLQRLKLYRLRSRVAMELMPETVQVAALWHEDGLLPVPEGVIAVADPRNPQLGYRVVGDIQAWAHGVPVVDAAAYDAMRLSLGVPDESRDLTPEKSFVLPFGFEFLHAVDFRKGCYVGQEVTARSKHLGTLRKFMYVVKSEDDVNLPAMGTVLYCDGEAVGEMLSSRDCVGLAMLQVAFAQKDLYHGVHHRVSVSAPSWVKNLPDA